MTLPIYKTLALGIEIKGGFSPHKYSSSCPHLTLSSKLGMLWWPCCVYLSRTSWSITQKLGWTRRSWRLVSWNLKFYCLSEAYTNYAVFLNNSRFFVSATESSRSDVYCAKTLQWHDECGQTTRLWGTTQEFWSLCHANNSVQGSHFLCFHSDCRARSPPWANYYSKTPSLSPSRTAASSPEQRKDGSSFLSNW